MRYEREKEKRERLISLLTPMPRPSRSIEISSTKSNETITPGSGMKSKYNSNLFLINFLK
jgi:hypothetical protein